MFWDEVINAYTRQVASNPRLLAATPAASQHAASVAMRQCVNNTRLRATFQQLQEQAPSLVATLPPGSYTDTTRLIASTVQASVRVSHALLTCVPSTQDLRQSIASCATPPPPPPSQRQQPPPATRFTASMIPFLVVSVVCLGLAHAYKDTITRVVFILLAVLSVEWTFYTRQVRSAELALARDQKDHADKRTDQGHIRSFHYTCGLNGIGNYIACFQPQPDGATTPQQNVWGCLMEEVRVDEKFATPDDAYGHWSADPNLQAIDIISRPDGTYAYHFYSKVSKECVALMGAISRNPGRAIIPPLVCGMLDPIPSTSSLPAIKVPDYTFVFTLDGFLFYAEDGEWVRVNSQSAFVAASPDNVGVHMSPPQETIVELRKPIKGTYYYIDASKAGVEPSDDDYYYTIYSYRLDPTEKPVLVSSGFTLHKKLRVANLVEGKGIGPYKPNPKLLHQRNTTLIWDRQAAQADEEQDRQDVDTMRSERRLWAVFVALILGVAVADAASTTWRKR